MTELHILSAEEVRSIVREELHILLDQLRATPPADARLSTEQAAERAHVGAHTIRAWIKSGRLHATKPQGSRDYQIKPSDLSAFLDGRPERKASDIAASARRILEKSHGKAHHTSA